MSTHSLERASSALRSKRLKDGKRHTGGELNRMLSKGMLSKGEKVVVIGSIR